VARSSKQSSSKSLRTRKCVSSSPSSQHCCHANSMIDQRQCERTFVRHCSVLGGFLSEETGSSTLCTNIHSVAQIRLVEHLLHHFPQTNVATRYKELVGDVSFSVGIPFPPRRKDEPPLVFKNVPPASSAPRASDRADRPMSPVRVHHCCCCLLRFVVLCLLRELLISLRMQEPTVKEFSSLRESVNLCNEMLAYVNVEEDDPNSNELLKDLIQTCKDALPNVRTAIESGNFTSEDAMMELLALNDELTKMSSTFDELVKQRETFLSTGRLPKANEGYLDFTADSLSRPMEKLSVVCDLTAILESCTSEGNSGVLD
jgi:hypothetical protein